MIDQADVFGGIDAGGTTFKCAVGDREGRLLRTRRIAVTNPQDTLEGCIDFFRTVTGDQPIKALGIASFGPIDVDPGSPDFGTILKTTKPGWTGARIRDVFSAALDLPVHVDSDVNGALLAEMAFGAARAAASAAYITVGTGIGAGVWLRGGFAGRPSHPEFGHIPISRHRDDGDFPGVCPFHSDCLEGLASASAMRARWGEPQDLPASHPGWTIIADYLAQAARVLTLTLRLERIILGGGLMLAEHLTDRVRTAYDRQMAGYLDTQPAATDKLIVRAGLGDDAGLVGALLLASRDHPAHG